MKRFLQVKSFGKRLGIYGPERFKNADVSGFDDDAQSTKGNQEQDEYQNDRNSASKYGIHGR